MSLNANGEDISNWKCTRCGMPEHMHGMEITECGIMPICPQRRIKVVADCSEIAKRTPSPEAA